MFENWSFPVCLCALVDVRVWRGESRPSAVSCTPDLLRDPSKMAGLSPQHNSESCGMTNPIFLFFLISSLPLLPTSFLHSPYIFTPAPSFPVESPKTQMTNYTINRLLVHSFCSHFSSSLFTDAWRWKAQWDVSTVFHGVLHEGSLREVKADVERSYWQHDWIMK